METGSTHTPWRNSLWKKLRDASWGTPWGTPEDTQQDTQREYARRCPPRMPLGLPWGMPQGKPWGMGEILGGIPQGPSQAIPKVSLSGHPPGYPRVSHWEAQGIFIHQDKSQGSPEVILRKPGGPPRGSPLGDSPGGIPRGVPLGNSLADPPRIL